LLIAVRHFGGAVQFDNFVLDVVTPDRTARFQRHARVPPDGEIKRDDSVSAAEGLWKIAVLLFDDRWLGRTARVEFAGVLAGRQNRRKLLDVECNTLGRVLRLVRALSEDNSDRLADVSHATARQ